MRRTRPHPPGWIPVCLLLVSAGCAPRPWARRSGVPLPETWVVVRDPAVARQVTAPTPPELVLRPAGTAAALDVPPLGHTRITATLLGPIVDVERTTTYRPSPAPAEAFVFFTPAATPARQDWVIRVADRSLTVRIRDRVDAEAVAADPRVALASTDALGRVVVPVGTIVSSTVELRTETAGLVPWRDGAYELRVPREPAGDVAFAADVYGPGPVVVVSSPSHAIDAIASSLEHLHVALREPGSLRDDDFVLRYRVDPGGHPGAVVMAPGGADVLGVVIHPLEAAHEPVAAADVAIDWNGTPVADVRPATLGPVAAGTPLVVLARARGAIAGPVLVRARIGRQVRTLTLARDDAVPAAGRRALSLLWAGAGDVVATAHR